MKTSPILTLISLVLVTVSNAYCLTFDEYEQSQNLSTQALTALADHDYAAFWQLSSQALSIDDDHERQFELYRYIIQRHSMQSNWGKANAACGQLIDGVRDQEDRRLHIVYFYRGIVQSRLKDYQSAIESYQSSLRLHDSMHTKNNLAWLIATAPSIENRESEVAIKLAESCARQSEYRVPYILDTLAAAHANSGDFDNAVHLQSESIKLLPPEKITEHTLRLKLYQSKRPYRLDMDLIEELTSTRH